MPKKREDNIFFTHEWWFLSEYTLRVSNYKAFERQDQSWHCSVTIKRSWRIKGYEASSMERQVWNHTHTHRLHFALVYVGVESRGPGLFTLKKSVLTHSELDILNKNHAPLHPVGMYHFCYILFLIKLCADYVSKSCVPISSSIIWPHNDRWQMPRDRCYLKSSYRQQQKILQNIFFF